MKLARLQIALISVLLAGASLLALDRCAGDVPPGQGTYLGNGGGSGSGTGGGGPGSAHPPDWDSTAAPLSPEVLDSLLRPSGMADSLRQRVLDRPKSEEESTPAEVSSKARHRALGGHGGRRCPNPPIGYPPNCT